jgi:hypothetical protein
MIDAVKRACGVSVMLPALFAEPTIEGLAASVERARQSPAETLNRS